MQVAVEKDSWRVRKRCAKSVTVTEFEEWETQLPNFKLDIDQLLTPA